jgi:hypothetical protein
MAQIMSTEIVERGNSKYAVFTVPNSAGTGSYRVDVTNGRCDCRGWTLHKPNPLTGKRLPCKHLRQFGYSENTQVL